MKWKKIFWKLNFSFNIIFQFIKWMVKVQFVKFLSKFMQYFARNWQKKIFCLAINIHANELKSHQIQGN